MTVLLYLAGVLLFTIGVALSIGLHELGHLIPGKLYDVKVTQYFIGFGRTLWSRRRGETEYGVKAIPFGGYVKLVGMLPPAPDAEPGTARSSNTGWLSQLVSDARSAEYDQVEPEDHGRLFYEKPWWKRVVIMGAGVTINIVLAFLIFAGVFMGYGVQAPTTTVASVSQCVKVVRGAADPGACTPQDPVAPAHKAGLRPGDRLISFNGTPLDSYAEVQRLVRANEAGAATLVVERNGHRLTLHADTTVRALPALNDPSKSVRAGFLGITPTISLQRQGLGYVVSTMADGTWQTLKTIGHLPPKLYHVVRAALGLEQRDVNSPMSIVGAGRIAGDVASNQSITVGSRLATLGLLLGSLNLFLGLVNLVPLPPFDGGGIATTLYEAARRGVARLRGRPDPGAVDGAKLLPLTYAMALILIAMSLVLVWADIVAPVRLS